ncbi:MAG: hypothetical protein ACD_23C00562G0002 [uncultured bacterium]|nr:MAG: hypothetical protein ACD_23C00562G0002 [uncultured bacterium]
MAVSVFGMAFLLSLGLTRLVQRYAVHRGMIDRPNDRSSHELPTPRGGGLAIVVVFLGLCLWLLPKQGFSPDLLCALAGGGPVALVGFWDDRGHVPAVWRLLVHGIAATWAIVWLGGLPALEFDGVVYSWSWWGAPLAVLFVMWLINLYNFMDGIDGIAGVEAVTVALGAAAILLYADDRASGLSLVAFAGAALGFLRWNWPPAKIFMGDVGSGFLGFVLGVFALFTPMQSRMSFWSWLILFGVFLVDATVTLLVRALRREKLHMAHRSHAYQHLAQRFRSHQKITMGVLLINVAWLFPLACVATLRPADGAWLSVLAMAPLVVICLWAGAGKKA